MKNNYANVYIRGKVDKIIEFQISAFPLRHSTKMSKLKFLGHYYLINLILQFFNVQCIGLLGFYFGMQVNLLIFTKDLSML